MLRWLSEFVFQGKMTLYYIGTICFKDTSGHARDPDPTM